MKCLLIHPPIRAQDKPRHIPLGPGMLLSMIKDRHEVALADLNAARDFCPTTDDVYAYLNDALHSTKWDYIGVSGLSSQYKYIKKILPMIKKSCPEAVLMAGCGWCTYRPKEMMILNPEVDIVCIGEGEITIQEIVEGKQYADIKGIWYREDGQIIETAPKPLIPDIDTLPYPAYDLIPMDIYFKYSATMDSLEAMQAKRRCDGCYERGCPRSCAFSWRGDMILNTDEGDMTLQEAYNQLAGQPITITNDGKACLANKSINVLTKGERGYKREKISLVHKHHYKGAMLKITLRNLSAFPIHVTHNHNYFVRRKLPTKRSAAWYIQEVKSQDIKIGDRLLIPLPQDGHPHTRLLRETDEKLCRLAGLYLAEGHIGYDRKKEPDSINWTFSHEERDLVEEVLNLIKERLLVNGGVTDTGTAYQVHAYSKRWAMWFTQFGIGSANKKLPSVWMELPNDLLKIILNACLEGDGYTTEKHKQHQIVTTSPTLARQLFQIIAVLGFIPSIFRHKQRDKPHYIDGRQIISRHQAYSVRWQDEVVYKHILYHHGYMELPVDKIEEYEYDGDVYNVTIEPSHTCMVNMVWARQCSHNGASRYDLVMIHGKEKVRDMDEEYGFQNVARWNSPKYIAEHTWYLINEYNVDFIMNLDENLCSNRKRVFELCDRFISEGLNKKIKWGSLGDSASVSDEMLYAMKEAGCTYISYGGESASDRILLKDIGKGTTRAHNQQAVDCMKRVGMRPLMTFQIGFPSETIDDILETTHFFVLNNIKSDCFLDTPYPGTKYFNDYYEFILRQYDPTIEKNSPLEKKLLAEERFLTDLDDATDISATVSQNFNQAELLGLKALVANNDMRRILLFAHNTGRTHSPKWDSWCDVCSQVKALIIGNN